MKDKVTLLSSIGRRRGVILVLKCDHRKREKYYSLLEEGGESGSHKKRPHGSIWNLWIYSNFSLIWKIAKISESKYNLTWYKLRTIIFKVESFNLCIILYEKITNLWVYEMNDNYKNRLNQRPNKVIKLHLNV